MTASFEFRWLSLLGIATILFLLFGLMNVVVGVLTPFFIRPDRLVTSNSLLMSERTDTVLFGGSPSELVAQKKSLGLLRLLLLYWLAGLLLSFGLFQLAVTWFGLRQGQAWALWALTVSDLAMLPYWFLILNSYARGGATPGIGDVPPLLLYLAVIPIAAVIGWLGLRGG
ncbi:MAG TPA: hypothetical protein VJK02_06835 [Anaerolineales bacterium]|nr:hypothetical protein [Anaerolineales bacterium]